MHQTEKIPYGGFSQIRSPMYKPGQMLVNQQGQYWIRRAKMCITRYRFINPVGDDQQKFYKQKYILNVPISGDDNMVLNTQQSWMQLCIMNDLFDEHADDMSVYSLPCLVDFTLNL